VKTLFSFLLSAVAALTASAQIPNAGFETWTTTSGYNMPDSWDNMNAMTAAMSVYTCTKGTPGSAGTSYLKLVSKSVSGMGVMPGVATSGTLDQTNMSRPWARSGFAFSQRPQSLTGKWQYMASGSDQGYIGVFLTRWDAATGKRDTVAYALKNLTGMAMSWASFTLNLSYKSTADPDSAMILFSASGMTPVANSYLYVDALAFTGVVAAINADNPIQGLTVFPNPATEHLVITVKDIAANQATVSLINAAGMTVRTYAGAIPSEGYVLSTLGLAAGAYTLRVTTSTGTAAEKVILQ